MLFSIKKFFDIPPVFQSNEIDKVNLKKVFQKNGFFIIKNFYDEKKQTYYSDLLNKTLEIEENQKDPRVLSDALNHNSKFLDVVFEDNLNLINTKILVSYIFLQNLVFMQTKMHQWHRDLSTKDGKVLESNKIF